tara:strand:- start:563 stop:1168 length:606 start_codon:yes stop_codon:yes gene_type:complete
MDQFSGKAKQIRLFSDERFDLVRKETQETLDACAEKMRWLEDFEGKTISSEGIIDFLNNFQASMFFLSSRCEGLTDPYYVALAELERSQGKQNHYVLSNDQAVETIGFYKAINDHLKSVESIDVDDLNQSNYQAAIEQYKELFDFQMIGGLGFVLGHIDKNDRNKLLDEFKSDHDMHQQLVRAVTQRGDRQNGKGWQPEIV